MKPVFSTKNHEAFAEARELLTDGGILVTELQTTDLPGYKFGPGLRTLWVWFDAQYPDALRLLSDPVQRVAHRVIPEAFEAIPDPADGAYEKAARAALERVLNCLFGLAVAGGLVLVLACYGFLPLR